MATGDEPRRPAGLRFVLSCPCGERLEGADEDEIVVVAFAHLAERHPDLAGAYEREHVLAMARRIVVT
jgi:hypothetical protein